MERFIDTFLQTLLEAERPRTALDIGAGRLNQAAQMADAGCVVDAIEPFLSDDAEMPPTGVTLYRESAAEFFSAKKPVAAYDLIVARMSLQRMPPEFVDTLFAELLPTALRADGRLYVMVPASFALPAAVQLHWQTKEAFTLDVPTSDFKTITLLILQKRPRSSS